MRDENNRICRSCHLFTCCPGPNDKRCRKNNNGFMEFFDSGKFDLLSTLRRVKNGCPFAPKVKDILDVEAFCSYHCKRPCKTGKQIRYASQNSVRKMLGNDKKRLRLFLRACNVLHNIPHRAKKKGLPFDLDEVWLAERIKSGKCEATGMQFEDKKPFRPSFDRINNKLGYTKDNTWLVCWMYNRAKGEDSLFELQKMAEAICKNNNKCVDAFKERTGIQDVG